MTLKRFRILIVDDHRLVSDGIKQVLSEQYDASLIDVASTVPQALEMLLAGQPYDLLLTDIYLPGTDGYALLEQIRERKLLVPVIVISSTEQVSDIKHAIRLGASGFLSKSADSDKMLLAIDEVIKGNLFLSDEILVGMKINLDDSQQDEPISETIQLSRRQLDTLKLIEQGFTNKQIADILCLSESTVKSHIKALFTHLNVATRTACVREARQHNLLH